MTEKSLIQHSCMVPAHFIETWVYLCLVSAIVASSRERKTVLRHTRVT